MNRPFVFLMLMTAPLLVACATTPPRADAREVQAESHPLAKPATAAPLKPAVITAVISPANVAVAPLPEKLPGETHPGQFAFARELAAKLGSARTDRSEAAINSILAGATYQQSIIDAMTRPAEGKPWSDYRPIFINDARIDGGIAFLRENRALLEEVSQRYGVPSEIIVAIIGVETSYGRITGNYRVLDALATLAFHYPKRAPFFRGELAQLLSLPEATFPKPIEALKGSYAGAMGWGQFMPTSFANWAVDHDADGDIDLWESKPDIFASIAKYFVDHGWQSNAPVVHRARADAGADAYVAPGLEPTLDVMRLRALGYRTDVALDDKLPASLITLAGSNGPEYWMTHQNFFVISRYNRSPMYSLAVYQLAERIREGAGGA
ncbi:MAG: lytic murein transglycosylase B [Lysobacterales bacterium]